MPTLGAQASARRSLLAGLLGVVLAFAIWQLVASLHVGSGTLPLASTTLKSLYTMAGTGSFWSAMWKTLFTAGLGFLISIPIALPLGIATGLSSVAHRALRVVVEVLKPIPPIVILPLVVLKAGSTEHMAEILIVFTLVPSLIVIVAAGVRDTDPVALNTARSFRVGRLARIRRIVLPSSLPFVATGLRISIAGAVVTAVMAEIEAGAPGLGDQVNLARSAGQTTDTFAYVVALGALGIALTYVLNRFEHRALRWHVSVRGDGLTSAYPSCLPSMRQRLVASPVGAAVGSALRGAVQGVADGGDQLRLQVRRHLVGSGSVSDRFGPRIHQSRTGRSSTVSGSKPQFTKALGMALEVAVPVLLLAWWWVWSTNAHDLYFPAAGKIFTAVHKTWFFAQFGSDVVPSLENLGLGLLLAVLFGVAVGVAMAELPLIGEMLDPIVVFFRSIPGVAYVPIMILLIGFTAPMRITSIALAASFPVMIATVDGLRGVDAMMGQVSRAYAIPPLRRLFSVRLPAASPRIASGIELSIAVGVVVMVASELEGTSHGIGAQTILAQQSFNIVGMWSGIVLLAFLGVALNLAFRAVRVRTLAWYYQSRPTATVG